MAAEGGEGKEEGGEGREGEGEAHAVAQGESEPSLLNRRLHLSHILRRRRAAFLEASLTATLPSCDCIHRVRHIVGQLK